MSWQYPIVIFSTLNFLSLSHDGHLCRWDIKNCLVPDELLAHVFTHKTFLLWTYKTLRQRRVHNLNMHKHHLTTPWRSRSFRGLHKTEITLGQRVKPLKQNWRAWSNDGTQIALTSLRLNLVTLFFNCLSSQNQQGMKYISLEREMTFLNVLKRLTCLCHNNHFLPFAAQKHSDE